VGTASGWCTINTCAAVPVSLFGLKLGQVPILYVGNGFPIAIFSVSVPGAARTDFLSNKPATSYTAAIFLLETNKSINLPTKKIKSPPPIASSITESFPKLVR
jgi:hypothetical protein